MLQTGLHESEGFDVDKLQASMTDKGLTLLMVDISRRLATISTRVWQTEDWACYGLNVCAPQNSYIQGLTLKVLMFGDGVWGGIYV